MSLQQILITNSNDSLPKGVCIKCKKSLEDSLAFKKKCIKSDNTIKLHFLVYGDEVTEKTFAVEEIESIIDKDTQSLRLSTSSIVVNFETENDVSMPSVIEDIIINDVPLVQEETDKTIEVLETEKTTEKKKRGRPKKVPTSSILISNNPEPNDIRSSSRVRKGNPKYKPEDKEVDLFKEDNPQNHSEIDTYSQSQPFDVLQNDVKMDVIDNGNDTIIYPCQYCRKKYQSRKRRNNHIAKCRRFVFACTYCDITFKKKKNLHRHTDIVHLKKYVCICEICNATFTTKYVQLIRFLFSQSNYLYYLILIFNRFVLFVFIIGKQ